MLTIHFDDRAYPVDVRSDLITAYRSAWAMIAAPGNWWTAEQRIAIAQEVRNAQQCDVCKQRNVALSPNAAEHRHGSTNLLSGAAIDAAHRITTDASRLSSAWLEDMAAEGLTDGHYVELLGIAVAIVSVDAFHTALGMEHEELPAPQPGQPTRYRPPGAKDHGAWVHSVAPVDVSPAEAGLYGGAKETGNVLAAMSLVPSSVELLNLLGSAQYLKPADVPNPHANGERAISRAQIELLAGRVSSINECFY